MLQGKEAILDTTDGALPEDERGGATSPHPAPVLSRQVLPPKGSCWYCEKPLDSVRRFCGKACSTGFDEEAEFSR
ncbi:hypothetical protein AAKU55_004777 [Oxalobacteraceae bacterium GrIS 1.11]